MAQDPHELIRKLKAHEASARKIGNKHEADAFATKIQELEKKYGKQPKVFRIRKLDSIGIEFDFTAEIERLEYEIAQRLESQIQSNLYYISLRWVQNHIPKRLWPMHAVTKISRDPTNRIVTVWSVELDCGHTIRIISNKESIAMIEHCPECWLMANPEKIPIRPIVW